MEEIKEGYTRVSDIITNPHFFHHIDPDVLANKCRIGTNVHEKICAEVEGFYVEEEEGAKGYVESWMKWHMENKDQIKYLETEKRFYCDNLMITGCVDAIVEIDGYIFILDYKTSASANKKIWALQAAFYHYLVKEAGYFIDPTVIFIHLKKDGSYPKEVEFYCHDDLWEDAMSFYKAYQYAKC